MKTKTTTAGKTPTKFPSIRSRPYYNLMADTDMLDSDEDRVLKPTVDVLDTDEDLIIQYYRTAQVRRDPRKKRNRIGV